MTPSGFSSEGSTSLAGLGCVGPSRPSIRFISNKNCMTAVLRLGSSLVSIVSVLAAPRFAPRHLLGSGATAYPYRGLDYSSDRGRLAMPHPAHAAQQDLARPRRVGSRASALVR